MLANEQVIDGRCERCGTQVELRQLAQWFFRITDYADRLLDDLATIDWPEHVKTMQRNWIGRSIGAEVNFRCAELNIDYPVFTTRPDTLFGATFFVMAPEHPDVMRLAAGTEHEQAARDYVNESLNETNEERGNTEKVKTGVPLGRTVTNPVRIPSRTPNRPRRALAALTTDPLRPIARRISALANAEVAHSKKIARYIKKLKLFDSIAAATSSISAITAVDA